MSRIRCNMLLALAAVSLGVLGWDSFQPPPDFPNSGPVNGPARAPQPVQDAIPARPPQIIHLTADRLLLPGQRLSVCGKVRDLNPASPATISLEGPDGTMASAELQDGGTHEAVFTLQHPTPAIAPGSFSWKLRLNPSDDPIVLGVHVGDSDRPRVLLLQDHPSVEGARLQRWLTEAGSPVTTRTRVSAERYRVASSPGTAVDLERLDAPALASFDVVVAHAAAVDRLSLEEHEVLDLAIRRDGVGLLVLGLHEPNHDVTNAGPQPSTPSVDEVARGPSPAGVVSGRSRLTSPWIRQPDPSTDASVSLREIRVHLFNGIRLESPVFVLAAELVVPPAGQALAQDPQGRPIVAGSSRGRGRWACSIVLDSWRWRQHGQGHDYAHFWSTLLSALARPRTASSGAWSVVEASLPVFVDQPLSLVWSGAPDRPPPTAEMRARRATDESAIPLSLNRPPLEPSHGRAVFWPAHPGWQTVRALPAGPTFNFYVQPAQALVGVRAQQESDVARRTAGEDATPWAVDPSPNPASWSRPMSRLTAFLIFVFSAACLWNSETGSRLRGFRSHAPSLHPTQRRGSPPGT